MKNLVPIFACLYFYKIFLAVLFIICGAACIDGSCLMEDKIGAGFLGFGIGIIFSSFVSGFLVLFLTELETLTHGDILRYRFIFFFKFMTGLILLIVGIIYSNKYGQYHILCGSGLIGASTGIFVASIISMTMIGVFLITNTPY